MAMVMNHRYIPPIPHLYKYLYNELQITLSVVLSTNYRLVFIDRRFDEITIIIIFSKTREKKDPNNERKSSILFLAFAEKRTL